MAEISVRVTGVNVAEKKVFLKVTRTDTTVSPPDIWTYKLSAGISLDTSGGKMFDEIVDEAAGEIRKAFLADQARRSSKTSLLADFESKLLTKLAEMEVK